MQGTYSGTSGENHATHLTTVDIDVAAACV